MLSAIFTNVSTGDFMRVSIKNSAAEGEESTCDGFCLYRHLPRRFHCATDRDLDFLPPGGGEPHAYHELIASVDAILIGRETFEKVLTWDLAIR